MYRFVLGARSGAVFEIIFNTVSQSELPFHETGVVLKRRFRLAARISAKGSKKGGAAGVCIAGTGDA